MLTGAQPLAGHNQAGLYRVRCRTGADYRAAAGGMGNSYPCSVRQSQVCSHKIGPGVDCNCFRLSFTKDNLADNLQSTRFGMDLRRGDRNEMIGTNGIVKAQTDCRVVIVLEMVDSGVLSATAMSKALRT